MMEKESILCNREGGFGRVGLLMMLLSVVGATPPD
jgi:hypothetical protein